ncbi:MAG: hypothetical protein ACYSYU_02815 [Planctomycetota bacterium]|jgi:hypothetical protein
MDMYDSLFSSNSVLNEQIACQLFEVLPDQGPIMVIMNREGHCWPSSSEKFSKLNISESFMKEFCQKIDDGDEPVVTQIIALPKYSPESTLINIDLIEILISQIGLIAKLIEKSNQLYELQTKHHQGSSGHNPIEPSLN